MSQPAVLVEIVATQGSVPRGTDAYMVVTAKGFHGTIGGGSLEWQALAEAQKMLEVQGPAKRLDYVLGPDLGQCCGGRVTVQLSLCAKSDIDNVRIRMNVSGRPPRSLFLFGAGHVARALVLALAPLPFHVKWFDGRTDAFPAIIPGDVEINNSDGLQAIATAKPGSLAYIMTHSHTLDLALVDAALRTPHMAHVGVIGSATKRARFERRLREGGVDALRVKALMCPIGIAGITSKHPAAIAAAVAAQALQLDALMTAPSALPQLSEAV
jgi:xanthine dehydrogenase accessory factor